MRMREFIRANRVEIDQYITSDRGPGRSGAIKPTNDNEREEWVMSDESLYRWAQRAGVPV